MKCITFRLILAVIMYLAIIAAPLSAHAAGVIALPVTGQTGSTGTAWPTPRATTGNSTITDNLTGLVWVQAGNLMATRDSSYDTLGTAGDGLVSWQKALDYIKKLNTDTYLGFSDWRLPNVDELASLYDFSKTNPATALSFTGLNTTYWTSTSYAGSALSAWTVNLQSPGISYDAKTSNNAVLPVRGGKVISAATPDTSPPTILAFRLPTTWQSKTVPIQELTLIDDISVTGFLMSEDSATPASTAAGWKTSYNNTFDASYTFSTSGLHTLNVWVKDAAGNVSAKASATVTISESANQLTAYAASVKLPATGQLTSSTTGDDGNLRLGVAWPAARFTTVGNWVVSDNLTQLNWARQGNLITVKDPSFDADGTAGDSLVSWEHALDYVKKLNTESFLGHRDWRLPNVDELASLLVFDSSEVRPFADLGTTYWTSTSYAGDATQAWTVNLQSPGISYDAKTSNNAVLPVRGGKVISTATPDTSPPTILAFRLPQTWQGKTVPILELTLNDDIGVTGFRMSEDSATPTATAAGWKISYNNSFDASYTFATTGLHTLNVWVKDAAGNVSAKASATVTIEESANQLTAYAASVKLPATGQLTSSATGDDGNLRLGVAWPAARFTTVGNWVVSDNLTQLNWARQGNLINVKDPSFDADLPAGDSLVSWQHALDYVKKLNTESFLGFSDWRLPNVVELASLLVFDSSEVRPFTDLGTTYWTSTSYAGDATQAWSVNLQSPGISYAAKASNYGVLPVRGGKVLSAAVSDTSPPTILAFRLPQTWQGKTVPILELTLNDDIGVTGFRMSEDSATPTATAAGWKISYNNSFDASYTFATSGLHTLNVWLKDAAGNVSAKASATVTIAESAAHPGSIKLPATGQIVSSITGDDGSRKLGVAWPLPRFTTVGNWMVSDNMTQLGWVRPGNLITAKDPLFDVDGTAGDGLVSWQTSLDYIKKLNSDNFLGYSDWRLPNVDELASLLVFDSSEVRPFADLGTTYWTSTSYAGDATQAWTVNLQSPGISYVAKSGNNTVLPVRGGAVGTLASLSVLKLGSGTGSVVSQPAAIDCGNTCGVLLDHVGDALTLSATAATGSFFTGWGGACSGTGSCLVTLNSDVGVSANFNLLRTVTVNKSGTGDAVMVSSPTGINCGSTCSAKFPDTGLVTVTAQLPLTSVVGSWSGCDTYTDTQCTYTVNGADHQIGVFLASKNATILSLSLSSSAILNNGSIIASGKLTRLPDNGSDMNGQTVTITITPPSGSSQQPFSVTTTTDTAGHYLSSAISGFTYKGAYTIQATTAATATIIAAASPQSTLMVGAQAGYAIIIQGKYPTGEGLPEHQKTANRIYNTLKSRGFSDDTIQYLSYQDVTSATAAGVTVDGIPSRASIQSAITSWAKDKIINVAAPLWILMVDHGANGNFYINNETVAPADLDDWLTTMETATGTAEKRIIIDGSCYSGSFIPALAKSGRIIITSAASNEESYRGPLETDDGIRSGEYFLDSLFNQLKMGRSLKDSFDLSSLNTHALTDKGGANNGSGYGDNVAQHPLIYDNADNQGSAFTSNSGNGALSATIYLGTGQTITNAGEPADISGITPTIILIPGAPDQQPWLSTYGSSSNVDTAWVEVRSPVFTLKGAGGKATMQLTVELPKLPMAFNSTTGRWKAVAAPYTGTTFTGFTIPGRYELFYYTRDLNGTIFTKRGVVYRQSDSNTVPGPFNLTAPADASAQKTSLVLSWDAAVDPDDDPLTYTVLISRDITFASIDYLMEGVTNPSVAIDQDAALADLTTYYWRVKAIDQYGGIRYSTQTWSFKTDNTNGLPSILKGYVRASGSGTPIANATVSSGSVNVKTLSNGAYLMAIPTGTVTLTVSATGYQPQNLNNLTATAGKVVNNDISLSSTASSTKPGDCDNSGTVTIAEVQSAINMFLGLKTVEACVDVDSSNSVSIAEVQKVINSFLGL